MREDGRSELDWSVRASSYRLSTALASISPPLTSDDHAAAVAAAVDKSHGHSLMLSSTPPVTPTSPTTSMPPGTTLQPLHLRSRDLFIFFFSVSL